MKDTPTCLFCDKDNPENRIIIESDLCYARWDNSPVSNGHAEIVPKKHIESFFDLDKSQIKQIYFLICDVKNLIQEKYNPDGYNIGINDGKSAGRTIHHLHIHLIPRYKGDVENPRGGVRNVIPGKGSY